MPVNNTWCTIHRVWFAKKCDRCAPRTPYVVPVPAMIAVSMDDKRTSPRHALAEARKQLGISGQALSLSCGRHKNAVGDWERGKAAPTVEHWIEAMQACGYRVIVERGPDLALRGPNALS